MSVKLNNSESAKNSADEYNTNEEQATLRMFYFKEFAPCTLKELNMFLENSTLRKQEFQDTLDKATPTELWEEMPIYLKKEIQSQKIKIQILDHLINSKK